MTLALPKNRRAYAAALKRAEAACIRRIANYLRSPHRRRSDEEVQADLMVFAQDREDAAMHAERGARPDLDALVQSVFELPDPRVNRRERSAPGRNGRDRCIDPKFDMTNFGRLVYCKKVQMSVDQIWVGGLDVAALVLVVLMQLSPTSRAARAAAILGVGVALAILLLPLAGPRMSP